MRNLANPTTPGRLASPRVLTLVALVLASTAAADPVTYTGFTITDGQLGSWKFHNGLVYLSFQGDTKDVQFMQFTDPFGSTADTYVISQGTATVTIVSGGRTVHATFDPGQILVSSDLGSSGDDHVGARGVGFSSLTATGLEPAYPLGIEDGPLDWGDIFDPGIASPALDLLTFDLQSSTSFGGRAWSCVGFPGDCQAPNPLHTDRGDLTLANPYMSGRPPFADDSLSAGFFIADVGGALDRPPRSVRHARQEGKHGITYRAYTISDVMLGKEYFFGAQVYLTYEADASKVKTFDNGASSYGFINHSGRARLTIVSGGTVRTASFRRGEIYVYYDVGSSTVGFGSKRWGRGYPLALTANHDSQGNGLVENTQVEAVSDIIRVPANAANYTEETATLVTDLTNATVLSGSANSCIALDLLTSACSDFTAPGLMTSRGRFQIFEDFTEDERLQDPPVPGPYSIQWGVFWAERASKHDGEHGDDCDDGRGDHDDGRDDHDDGRDDD